MKVLLTGATSGIGQEVARILRERGDELWVVVRDASRADPRDHAIVADLAEPLSLTVADLPEEIDAVVHSAGTITLGAIADSAQEDWESQFRINLLAPAMLTRIALPALRRAQGTVVFVNSGAGLRVSAGWSAYAASKHGLRALADGLREEEKSLRVTSIFPGRTATPMQESVHAQEGSAYDAERWIRPETVARKVVEIIDLPNDALIPEVVIRPR
ncbi:short chain dehydrogenase [Nocardioides baekrokdamisoli]|uniref:Short chain dehydrogenase n=1 Tax=Nocardioides baekrokdamisoli TaxID=1804624 RepID=A0A3G9IRZ2_9ACTN|nr:SDR family oxidoreductase [Nocardioides baekrokdamisoli]BBH16391.1 short chain dehydrogenase [Nocardioides baekrokdamisoli]